MTTLAPDTPPTIEAEDFGPISRFAAAFPTEPGMYVFRGQSGQGKTRLLDAMQDVLAGVPKPRGTPSDGAERGRMAFDGIVLYVDAKASVVTGKLTLHGLAGPGAVGRLIDPRVKGATADQHRLKALLELEGGAADLQAFLDFDVAVGDCLQAATRGLTDPVALEKAVSKDVHAAAKRDEAERDTLNGRIQHAEEQHGDVNLDVETDAAKLQQAQEAAIAKQGRLQGLRDAACETKGKAARAQGDLAKAEEAHEGLSLDVAQHELDVAYRQVVRIRGELDLAEKASEDALQAKNGARDHENQIAQWQALIDDVANCDDPGEEGVLAAQGANEDACKAIEAGRLARAARVALATVETEKAKAVKLTVRAKHLRKVAKTVDSVLPTLITSPELSWHDGQLVAPLHTRSTAEKPVPYSELSAGEQSTLAITVAARSVGAPGVVVIDQEIWQHIQGADQRAFAEQVRAAGLFAFSAMVDDGELRLEEVEAEAK